MKTRIYISGPITNVPAEKYMKHFDDAAKELMKNGYAVINPARMNCGMPPDSTHSDYMTVSLAELSTCDAIFMLKGWEQSEGARLEFQYAAVKKKAIFFEGGR